MGELLPNAHPRPSSIADFQAAPTSTNVEHSFVCRGLHCSLSWVEREGLYKVRDFTPTVAVMIEGEWLEYRKENDWELRETVWHSDMENPSLALLSLLEDRVERLLALYPTRYARLMKKLDAFVDEALEIASDRTYPERRRSAALQVLWGVGGARNELRALGAYSC